MQSMGLQGQRQPWIGGDGRTLASPTGRSYKTKMKYMWKPHEDSEQKVVERLGNKTLKSPFHLLWFSLDLTYDKTAHSLFFLMLLNCGVGEDS